MKRLNSAFSIHFEQQSVIQWLLLNDGTLQAIFNQDGNTCTAIFEATGKLISYNHHMMKANGLSAGRPARP